MLWIAFKFVSLYRMTQPSTSREPSRFGCELLSNLYLCIGWHSCLPPSNSMLSVVNCFQICIFVSDDTAIHASSKSIISCELLSNLYLCIGWHSSDGSRKPWRNVVNCFQICIFVSDDTACRAASSTRTSCELLSNLYLCIGWHSSQAANNFVAKVVNCFQICIFVSDDTACYRKP